MSDSKVLISVPNFTVPTMTSADTGYAVLKIALSAVPGAGGPLGEMVELFFAPPIEQRREAWMKQVAHALNHLAGAGFTIDSLQTNDRFISAVLQASIIARRTHLKEKLDALRNAVISIAVTQTPDETLESILLGYIDSLHPMAHSNTSIL